MLQAAVLHCRFLDLLSPFDDGLIATEGVVRRKLNSLTHPCVHTVSGHTQMAPLGKSDGAVQFEIGSVI